MLRKGFIAPKSPIMRKFDKLYVGSYGDTIVDGGHSPELPGFANPAGFFNFLIETLFKFADLDKIPDKTVFFPMRGVPVFCCFPINNLDKTEEVRGVSVNTSAKAVYGHLSLIV